VSCWGENPDWDQMPDTYILKYNLVTGTSEKIDLPGGPEGIVIANGKLYAALNYSHQIAVMNLTTEEFSYISTDAVSSSVVKDADDNVYVALFSSYSDVSTEIGLGLIDTKTDKLTLYELDAVSSQSASILAVSKDNSKVYVVAAEYDENWNMVGGIQVFNTATKAFESTPLISNITGINAVSVDPENGDVYVLISTGGLTKGEMNVYSADHTLKAEETVGANPSGIIFLN
jgi:DNA-binding beta-propeller fold protein YncE